MTVRKMRQNEIKEVQRMAHELWPYETEDYDFSDEQVFVWDKEGELGGFVTVSLRPWSPGCTSEPCPHIEGWFVQEDLRGRGVGRALMQAVEAWCKEEGFTELASDVELHNTDSIDAHKKLGFKETRTLQYFCKSL